jgi:sugar transferase (PEP-CTERM/EpsH1 system associated)
MKILDITNLTPLPANSGARLRVFNLLGRIAECHEVSLACHLWDPEEEEVVPDLKRIFRRVEAGHVRRRPFVRLVPEMARAILKGRPPEVALWRSPELAAGIRRLVSEVHFDIIHVEEYFMAPYLDFIPKDYPAKRVLTFHNIGFDQRRTFPRTTMNPLLKAWYLCNARLLEAWEPSLGMSADRCIAVSERDKRILLAKKPSLRVDVVPNGTDTKEYLPSETKPGLPPAVLFVGDMRYEPSVDAVRYFAREILPLIRREVPDMRFWIVGREPAPAVQGLNHDGVCVTGAVPDVRPYYERCFASIVPLRAGGGTRLKILEAMALGLPVVSTSIGAEGLEASDGEHLLIADEPAEFAARVVRVFREPALGASMAEKARRLVESRYDWDDLAARQLRVYEELAHEGR